MFALDAILFQVIHAGMAVSQYPVALVIIVFVQEITTESFVRV